MRTRIILFSFALALVPLFAEAAGAPKTFKELADQIFAFLTAGVSTLIALGIVIYLWGIASNMSKLSEGEPSAYRAQIFWGVIIIFVMVSVMGIVRLVGTTLFQGGGGSGAPSQKQTAPNSVFFNLNGDGVLSNEV